MTNKNGYVIYPMGTAAATLEGAHTVAAEMSREGDYVARIEDCDDEKLVARYRNGQEVE